MKHFLEEVLDAGNPVLCGNYTGGCFRTITKGNEYIIRGKYMYCCQECADEYGEGDTLGE